MTQLSRSQRNVAHDPFALVNHIRAIGSELPQLLLDSARPLEPRALDVLETAQAERDAPVGLREVPRTALHRKPADPFRRPDTHLPADAVPLGLSPPGA